MSKEFIAYTELPVRTFVSDVKSYASAAKASHLEQTITAITLNSLIKKQPVMTICSITTAGEIRVGISMQSAEDVYDKTKGRALALQRANVTPILLCAMPENLPATSEQNFRENILNGFMASFKNEYKTAVKLAATQELKEGGDIEVEKIDPNL